MLKRLRELALERAGMSLEQFGDDALRHKLAAELERAGGLRAYAAQLEADSETFQRFIEQLCTHETRFFRHPAQFDYMRVEHLPSVRRTAVRAGRPVHVWSAACSTGEEPASLAVTLAQVFKTEVAYRVFATDISRHALERARALRWPVSSASHVPPELLSRYFLRGVGAEAGFMRLAPELSDLLQFDLINLVHSPIPAGRFELILCRNVLIYFPTAVRQQVARRLLAALTPDGLLFTGPSEGLTHHVSEAEMVAPYIYRRRRVA